MRRSAVLSLLFVVLLAAAAAAHAAAPVITDIAINRARDTLSLGYARYHESVTVQVADADGAGDIASVTIVTPASAVHVIANGEGGWQELDPNTIECTWSEQWLLAPPQAGTYEVTASDSSANEDNLVTPAAGAVSDTHPVLVAPVTDSVISDTTPTFEWTAGLAGCSYQIALEQEGTWGPIWSADVAGTSCDYNFDASASQAELLPNRAYFWRVYASRAEDDHVTDARVGIYTTQETRGRFTVYGDWSGTPPALSGKLTYSVCHAGMDGPGYAIWGETSIRGYGTDPASRTWYESDSAGYPDWSPDGSQLLYNDASGLFVDSLDGSDPVQVPGVNGGDCRWASDSGRVVYAPQGPPSPYTQYPPTNFDVWVSNLDGSHQYPLAESMYHDERWPDWAPDGLWIAYRKLPATDGSSLWLIRYDGTEGHPLLATDVVGYPGYDVTYMGEHAWSHDATKLVVNFQAEDAESNYISGIGIISRDGGSLTPVFLSPPGYECCAGVHLPNWSPDGTQIVFSSAHHVADPVSAGSFEPRVELWLANADGSGTPVRLTYDEGFSYYPTWWDRNTDVGENVEVTKGNTTVTFEEVNDAGNTSVTVYEEPIDLPYNFEFCEDQYEITTTADVDGPITICMTYDEADIPTGSSEASLCLLHYNETGDYWEDITTSRAPDTNTICGETASLSVFAIAAARTAHFPDVPAYGLGPYGTESYWAFGEIGACADAGIVAGYGDGSYQPTWSVSRSQMAVFIARSIVSPMGEDGIADYEPPATPSFTDVPTSYWAYNHIELLSEEKIVSGYPDGYYRPSTTVTRDQMAVYIARAVADPRGEEGLAGYVPPETPSFSDLPADHWAYKYVEYVADQGIVYGYPDGFYRPQRKVTRDQMAVYVARAFGLL